MIRSISHSDISRQCQSHDSFSHYHMVRSTSHFDASRHCHSPDSFSHVYWCITVIFIIHSRSHIDISRHCHSHDSFKHSHWYLTSLSFSWFVQPVILISHVTVILMIRSTSFICISHKCRSQSLHLLCMRGLSFRQGWPQPSPCWPLWKGSLETKSGVISLRGTKEGPKWNEFSERIPTFLGQIYLTES